jgi:hypothetical protein
MDGQVPERRSDVGDAVPDSWSHLGFPSEEDMLDWIENHQRAGPFNAAQHRKAASVLRFGVFSAGVLVIWRLFSPRP